MTFLGTTVNKVANEGLLNKLSDEMQKTEREVHVLETSHFHFVL